MNYYNGKVIERAVTKWLNKKDLPFLEHEEARLTAKGWSVYIEEEFYICKAHSRARYRLVKTTGNSWRV